MEAPSRFFEGRADVFVETAESSNSPASSRQDVAPPREGKYEGGGPQRSRNTSGLPGDYFNVLSADKAETLSIPPDLIEPTAGSRSYLAKNQSSGAPTFSFYLCKLYTSGSTCAHGSFCDFIHSRHVLSDASHRSGRVKAFQVHWSTPIPSLAEAVYERHEPGFVFHINQNNFSGSSSQASSNNAPDRRRLASEYVYKTKGSEEAMLHGSSRLLRLCKHYEREKCARGRLCRFVHRVHLSSSAPAPLSPPMPLTAPTITAPLSYNQAAELSTTINLSQSPANTRPRFSQGVDRLTTNVLQAHPRREGGISFDARGVPRASGGVFLAPSTMLTAHPSSPAQQTRLHPQQAQKQQPQPPILPHPTGYHFTPVYTSQQSPYMRTSATQLSATPLQFSTSYCDHSQQHGTQQQNMTPELQQPSVLPLSPAPDYLLSQVLFTLM
ncbi:uncharacterized protein Tco025E_00204 [Trypanosoma conorhini]|uniref:C3H1-type domain-containing protein n=1 Tax=Trypanosoma conorhini TaxID=83891 RepID=A0A3R7LMF9_9TRYP|nr:uncharacterized protein Tco025E_00204 [Trypanosoma conorhini]RNF27554.1 hypothetical protein Tco025E_00204 [Trypanosoma conorhini]